MAHQQSQILIRQRLGVNHQARATVTDQLLNRLLLLLGIVIAVANQQEVAGGLCHLLDRLDHGAKEGIGNIRDDQPQSLGTLMCQGACIGIGVVFELGHGLENRIARCLAGLGRIIDYTRNGSDRNSRQTSYILDCCHFFITR